MIRLRPNDPNSLEAWDLEYSKELFIRGNRNVYERILYCLKDCTSIFDYGCGMGELISYLKQNGKTVLGYERSTLIAKKAMQEHTNIEIVTRMPMYRFDAVLCCEVLEHTENPFELAVFLESLAKNRIILTVPAEDSAGKSPYHLWLFEEKDFSTMFSGKVNSMEILPTAGNYLTRIVIIDKMIKL